ncbi:MAG: phage tail sheath family protein [Desulfobacterales bacterium]|nr:phage tail sheath family protein [Desulfobacterales bacterium]
MGQMKTPGVYIVEKNAFPNSIVEVATAVPAFIGHTERAANGGMSLKNKPWRITSMAEFHQYYGGAPTPLFEVKEIGAPETRNAMTPREPILPTGPKDPKASKDPKEGKEPKAPEPRPVVATPSRAAGGKPDITLPNGKGYSIKRTGQEYILYYCMLLFYQNGGGPCYIVSVGDYTEAFSFDRMTGGIKQLIKEQEPTMVVIPEAVKMDRKVCISIQQASLQHCGLKMKNRVSILDVHDGYKDRQDETGDCIDNFRNALGKNYLDYSSAYYPWLNTTILQEKDLSFFNFVDAGKNATLQKILRDELITPLESDLKSLDPGDPEITEKKGNMEKLIRKQNEFIMSFSSARQDAPDALMRNNALISMSKNVGELYKEMARKLNLLPPGPAMAGVYTMVDNARGVWKAPANVSLNSVVSPSVNITHDDQEDLNVTEQGKSVNAIRSFIGEGVLVWGARTLDGNSLDWRYVNVRRTMIMLEESIKLASKAYVFEDNNANTWSTMKSMIGNFLNGIWKRGGLAGTTPEDAFSVFVGLGETMTPNDILEGILRITVLVAITRPAEFIEITFQQQMQKS